MLIYLITSLPKLYIGEKPKISKEQLIKRVYECLPKNSLSDFNLLVQIDKEIEKSRLQSSTSPMGGKDISERMDNSSMRELFVKIYEKTQSNFLKLWVKYSLNIDDVLVGLLCKRYKLSKQDALKKFSNKFDSTYKIIIKNYESSNLGLSNRFSWFNKLNELIQLNDLENTEKSIDLIKLQIIDYIKPYELFHMDMLLAYYLELSILERQLSFNATSGEKMLRKMLDSITI